MDEGIYFNEGILNWQDGVSVTIIVDLRAVCPYYDNFSLILKRLRYLKFDFD